MRLFIIVCLLTCIRPVLAAPSDGVLMLGFSHALGERVSDISFGYRSIYSADHDSYTEIDLAADFKLNYRAGLEFESFRANHLNGDLQYESDVGVTFYAPRGKWYVGSAFSDGIHALGVEIALSSLVSGGSIDDVNVNYSSWRAKRIKENAIRIYKYFRKKLSKQKKRQKTIDYAANNIAEDRGGTNGVKELSDRQKKSIRTHKKRIAAHKEKLQSFIDSPTVKPGMENLPIELIKKQQLRRVEHLETEINTFMNNIEKIKRGEIKS